MIQRPIASIQGRESLSVARTMLSLPRRRHAAQSTVAAIRSEKDQLARAVREKERSLRQFKAVDNALQVWGV